MAGDVNVHIEFSTIIEIVLNCLHNKPREAHIRSVFLVQNQKMRSIVGLLNPFCTKKTLFPLNMCVRYGVLCLENVCLMGHGHSFLQRTK